MQTIGGWSVMATGMDGVCRNVLAWTENSGLRDVAFGTNEKLYVARGSTLYDITPTSDFTAGAEHGAGGPGYGAGTYGSGTYGGSSSSDYFPTTWSLANWGEQLIANPRGQGIFLWANNTGTEAATLTNSPAAVNYTIVTPERQVLAFGCTKIDTNFNPLAIRGSNTGDNTAWTLSSSSNAFEYILPGSGRIVAASMVGQYVAVWTDSALYLGEFIGEFGQKYRFDLIAEGHGLIGPNAFKVINQTAFWVGPDYQFRTWSLSQGEPTIIPCPIRNDFKDNITPSQFDKIAATSVGQYGEVWWFYPDNRDGIENSRYVALSTLDGTWFRGRMARSACIDAGPTQAPIFVSPDGTAYWHETGQTADGGALECHVTTADQYIDEAGRHLLIRGLWPDFEDQQGAVSVTVNLRKWPQANTVYTKGPYSLPVNVSKKDFMASGRVASVTFSGNSSPCFFRLGKPTWDVEIAGEY